MGEYAIRKSDGQEVKIGTCESMYYLRADQVDQVRALPPGNVSPASKEDQKVIRFRFPWPDEDDIPPGAGDGTNGFNDYERSIPLAGITPPAGFEHYSVQFSARPGYLLSIPCPQSSAVLEIRKAPDALRETVQVHRNGFPGGVGVTEQAYRNGNLAVICRCMGCGALYNVPTLELAIPIIEACIKEAEDAQRIEDRDNRGRGLPTSESGRARFYLEIAKRIKAGYITDEMKEAVGA